MSCFLQVLMEKVKAHKESANSPPIRPSTNKPIAVRHNDGASTNNYQVPPQAVSSDAAGENQECVVQGEGTHPSNRMHSDDMHHIQPQMTAEDMARLFKNPHQQQQQPAHYKPSVDISEQQRIEDRERKTEDELSKSEQETDKVLQELERARKEAPLRPPPSNSAPGSPKPSCIKNQASQDDELEESGENLDDDRPYDPNLVCPKCGKQYRVGEIQKMKRHILRCSN